MWSYVDAVNTALSLLHEGKISIVDLEDETNAIWAEMQEDNETHCITGLLD